MIRIGTRESQLAVWQAKLVAEMLLQHGFESELVFIKSDGDIDLVTPLYEIGVQGIFTKTLDAALLSNKIDVAVHSMKDVPTQLATGLAQSAVLARGSHKDIFVPRSGADFLNDANSVAAIATSSIRRIAQWIRRYPNHTIENLRGNVNTRLQKVAGSNWQGGIFAAAGLERIGLRPENAVDLDWMLPAPAQGAVMIVCKEDDVFVQEACSLLNDENTALCAKIERDFLRTLFGGCSTPVSALAQIKNGELYFEGNIISLDGKEKVGTERKVSIDNAVGLGITAANEVLENGGWEIVENIRNNGK